MGVGSKYQKTVDVCLRMIVDKRSRRERGRDESTYGPVVTQVPPGSVDVSAAAAALHVIVIARDELLRGQRVS